MPRNGSSVYSLPAGNPVIAGTVIATAWANSTLTDIATALTQSLSTDGSTSSVSLAGKSMSGGTFTSPTVSGQLNLTSGQIAFPAVQVPSAGANVLDDYEEGTWTPTITCASPGNLSVTYSTQFGTYTKVGNCVTIGCVVVASAFTWTTSTGTILVGTLPFSLSGNFRGAAALSAASGLVGSANDYFAMQIDAGVSSTQLSIGRMNSGTGASSTATISLFPSGSGKQLTFSGSYLIS